MSWLPVRTCRLSGAKATARTQFWCGSGLPTSRPVATSQTCAWLSWLPVTTKRPSGLKAAQRYSQTQCGMGRPWLPLIRVLGFPATSDGSRLANDRAGSLLTSGIPL